MQQQARSSPPNAMTQVPPAEPVESTQERLTRISRMRTLSAMLDDDVDEQLPPELLAMFTQNRAKLKAAKLAGAGEAAGNGDEDGADDMEQGAGSDFLCVECRAHESEVFCEQCHDYFCELCYGGQHRKGNRKNHTFQPRIVANPAKDVAASTPATAASKGNTNDPRMSDNGDDSNEVREGVMCMH